MKLDKVLPIKICYHKLNYYCNSYLISLPLLSCDFSYMTLLLLNRFILLIIIRNNDFVAHSDYVVLHNTILYSQLTLYKCFLVFFKHFIYFCKQFPFIWTIKFFKHMWNWNIIAGASQNWCF